VIGVPGEGITAAEAERHIASYMVLCDWSARDLQARKTALRLGPAKGKDSATSAGDLADIHWFFPQLVEHACRETRLRTGDVIGSGTVGSGCLLELSRRDPAAHPWLGRRRVPAVKPPNGTDVLPAAGPADHQQHAQRLGGGLRQPHRSGGLLMSPDELRGPERPRLVRLRVAQQLPGHPRHVGWVGVDLHPCPGQVGLGFRPHLPSCRSR
jgi:hypothetical protein